MAINNPRQKDTADPEDLPQTPDRVRAEAVAAHQQRKREEPAAASLEADAEAGGSQTRPPSEAEAAQNPDVFVVNGAGDVRAGPGDAGATDRPRVLDDPRDKPPSSRWILISMLVVAAVVLVAVLAL